MNLEIVAAGEIDLIYGSTSLFSSAAEEIKL